MSSSRSMTANAPTAGANPLPFTPTSPPSSSPQKRFPKAPSSSAPPPEHKPPTSHTPSSNNSNSHHCQSPPSPNPSPHPHPPPPSMPTVAQTPPLNPPQEAHSRQVHPQPHPSHHRNGRWMFLTTCRSSRGTKRSISRRSRSRAGLRLRRCCFSTTKAGTEMWSSWA